MTAATLAIVGGSGRFTDAIGSGYMQIIEKSDGSFTFTVDGVVDY